MRTIRSGCRLPRSRHSRRRADELRHAVSLHDSDCPTRLSALSSSKRKLRQSFWSTRFATTPVGPRKRNEPIGRCGSHPRSRALHGVGNFFARPRFADMRCFKTSSMRFSLSASSSSMRETGTPVHWNDERNVVLGDFLFQKFGASSVIFQSFALAVPALFQRRQCAVANLGRLGQITRASALSASRRASSNCFFKFLMSLTVSFSCSISFQLGSFFAQVGDLFFDFFDACFRFLVGFFFQRLFFRFPV